MSSGSGTDKKAGGQIDTNGLIVPCPVCGQRNRIAFSRFADQSRCGKCHTMLTLPGEPVEVPDAQAFDAFIAQSTLPIVVDFWAPWCGPCHMVAPEIAKVAKSNAGRFVVAKVNTDAVEELGDRLMIRSIPTMAVFAKGREVARTAGARPAPDIEAFIRSALEKQ